MHLISTPFIIFSTLEEEEVLFIYGFPFIYWLSNRWREKTYGYDSLGLLG